MEPVTGPGEYSDYTIGLALFDAVPVLLFLMSGLVIYALYDSPVLLAGVMASFLGGFSKVIWKMLIVIKNKDYTILTKAFHYLLPGGFALMLLSLLLRAGHGALGSFWRAFTTMPPLIFFIAGFCGMFVMGLLGKKMDHSARSDWYEEMANTIAQTFILIGMISLYFALSYPASDAANEALAGNENVKVTEAEDFYLFDGPGAEDVIVFYQGAKVDEEAYAPLMSRIAETGTDCFLCRMPCNFALMGKDMAEEIREDYLEGKLEIEGADPDNSYKNWYLAGHSLGGVAASMLAADDESLIDDSGNDTGRKWRGVIFLASYPTDKMTQPDLAIYGSEDHVLNIEKYKKAGESGLWNEDFTEVMIEGGNHAQFGSYCEQKDDGAATITETRQQEQTAAIISEWISRK